MSTTNTQQIKAYARRRSDGDMKANSAVPMKRPTVKSWREEAWLISNSKVAKATAMPTDSQ
jgi:hypothetical protein